MTFRFSNRVKVTASAPGTAAFPATAAATGFIGFNSIPSIANGDIVPYTAWDGGANWETGWATYNSTGPVLTRTTIVQNSLGNTSAINFSSGIVTIFCDATAASLPLLDSSGNLGLGGANITTTGTLAAGVATLTSVSVGSGVGVLNSTGLRLNSGGDTCDFNFSQLLLTGGSNSWFVRANSGGVQLNAGATSWSAVSEREKKKDFSPIANPLEILKQLRGAVGVGRYKDQPDDSPLRPFVMYEETAEYFPPAAHYSPKRVVVGKDGKETVLPEHKGVSLEQFVPLLLACCGKMADEIAELKAILAKG